MADRSTEAADYTGPEELERFRTIRSLRNHWSRPASPPAYYWYLTFEDSPEIRALAGQCQEAISFPCYDLTPPHDLHVTLDRIAFTGSITPGQLADIKAAATRACESIPAFRITIGSLGGTPGAIGFTASPARPVREIRDTLRAVTLSVYPDAPVRRPEFHPHVAIAYANSDEVPAAEAIAAVEKLNPTARASVTITAATLVLLQRRPRAYEWEAVTRIPLTG
jgi:2'-5' RNA ligase